MHTGANDRILAAIEALDDDFQFFSGKPVDPGELAAFEGRLAAPLPAAHRSVVAARSCVAVVVSPKVWPAPEPYEIRPAWQMIRGIEILGLAPAGHPLSLPGHREALAAMGAPTWIPLAKIIGAARYLCASDDGGVRWFERGDAHDAGDFETAVLGFLAQLAVDKERVKQSGITRS